MDLNQVFSWKRRLRIEKSHHTDIKDIFFICISFLIGLVFMKDSCHNKQYLMV